MAELTALSTRSGGAIATFLNFYVPTVIESSKSVNNCWSYCKNDTTLFFEIRCS